MKRHFVYIGILVLMLGVCITVYATKNHHINMPNKFSDGKIEFDFVKQNQPKASRILYKYILESQNLTAKEAKETTDITQNQIKAFEFDLNDDGINEVIGTIESVYFCGSLRDAIFILQKQNGKYQSVIKYHNCHKSSKVHINENKTNGFNDITVFVSDGEYSSKTNKQYHNGFYYDEEDYNNLKDYIDNKYYEKMPEGSIKYNIPALSNEKAEKILYEYLYKYLKNDLKMSTIDINEIVKLKPENIKAIEIDLNSDGVNEIIGYCDTSYFLNGAGGSGAEIFILKKINKEYKNIMDKRYSYFVVWDDFYILPDKTNGYKDLILYVPTSKEPMPVFIKFNKYSYSIK